MKNFAIFSLLHKQLNSSQKFSMTIFSLLHKKPVIYQTKFPTYLFLNHFTHKIYYLPQKFINFFLVSPFQMVSPGAARPLRPRLSTPLFSSLVFEY